LKIGGLLCSDIGGPESRDQDEGKQVQATHLDILAWQDGLQQIRFGHPAA
jgi:hypothetical protein